MSLTIVPFGPYSRTEIAEPLYVRVHETLRGGGTAPLELFDQTPAWSAYVTIEQPSGSKATRAVVIVDPASLPIDEPQNFDAAEDGWIRLDWAEGDFDEVGDPQVQFTLDNGTLRLLSTSVYAPAVAEGPASGAVLV